MKRHLHEIQEQINDRHIAEALEAVAKLEVRLGNATAILTAADAIGVAAYTFAELVDGHALTAVDAWLPHPSRYK